MSGNIYTDIMIGCAFGGIILLLIGLIILVIMLIDCMFDLGFEDFCAKIGEYILAGLAFLLAVVCFDFAIAVLNMLYCEFIHS